MNRKQRRTQKNGVLPPKEPVYQMKQSDIERIRKEAREEASADAMILLFAIPIKILHDEYGWGSQKRLPEFGEKLTDEYQAFSENEMTLEDYAQLVYEYTGLKFQKGDG